MTIRIAVVIPTRNRQSFAIKAIQSLLAQDQPLDIYVCDNSTSPDTLRDFCEQHPAVTYLRPHREVPMGENWDWAIRQAMARSTATHFSVHYDRKLSKPGAWSRLAAHVEQHPDALISFPVDHIIGQPPPLRLWLTPWTGKLFAIDSLHVAGLISRGCVTEVAHVLPVLSNCLVPRSILQAVQDRFGDVCDSTAPDGAFMMRFFALHPGYIHHDHAPGILYGSVRSNGLGYLRGKGGDFADFVKMARDGPWLDLAPVPGISLGSNMLYHEYERVRRATGDRLGPLDRPATLRELGTELRWIADPKMKAALRSILIENGWTGPEPVALWKGNWRSRWYEFTTRRRMKRGQVPPTISGFTFASDEQALTYALRYPSAPQPNHDHLAVVEPVEIQPRSGVRV